VKPKLFELFEAIVRFGERNQRANSLEELEDSRNELRKDFEKFGIDEQFDWTR
jgi:hypothetical protein